MDALLATPREQAVMVLQELLRNRPILAPQLGRRTATGLLRCVAFCCVCFCFWGKKEEMGGRDFFFFGGGFVGIGGNCVGDFWSDLFFGGGRLLKQNQLN